MTAELSRWQLTVESDAEASVAFGDPDDTVILIPRWAAEIVVRQHNEQVDAVRPVIGDVERWLSRVLAAAIREVVRDALPWRRRGAKGASTTGDNAVDGGGHRG